MFRPAKRLAANGFECARPVSTQSSPAGGNLTGERARSTVNLTVLIVLTLPGEPNAVRLTTLPKTGSRRFSKMSSWGVPSRFRGIHSRQFA